MRRSSTMSSPLRASAVLALALFAAPLSAADAPKPLAKNPDVAAAIEVLDA